MQLRNWKDLVHSCKLSFQLHPHLRSAQELKLSTGALVRGKMKILHQHSALRIEDSGHGHSGFNNTNRIMTADSGEQKSAQTGPESQTLSDSGWPGGLQPETDDTDFLPTLLMLMPER
eukprot:1099813-Rhodomonas_salina.2